MSRRRVFLRDDLLRAVEKVHEYKFTPDSVIRTLQAAFTWLDEEVEKLRVPNQLTWQAGFNAAIDKVRDLITSEETEPLRVIFRHPGVYRVNADGSFIFLEGRVDQESTKEEPK
jgi:hypothetical protein